MKALNEVMLPGNTCFGCSLENPDGLQIRIYRDAQHDGRLVGHYAPRPTHGGFPGIVHGGVQFTVLDCMAGWQVIGLRAAERLIPLTRKADIKYRRPAPIGEPLRLTSQVIAARAAPASSKALETLDIRTELCSDGGDVITIAEFQYITVREDTVLSMLGIDELPESYRRHFGDAT
ncbi:MAG: hypothetical protein KC503_31540 [Myxococcales bacterium]|nr:hypothetical protein [Myxococcales bacterium]